MKKSRIAKRMWIIWIIQRLDWRKSETVIFEYFRRKVVLEDAQASKKDDRLGETFPKEVSQFLQV